jgi:hypothetical protein
MIDGLFSWLLLGRGVGGGVGLRADRFHLPRQWESLVLSGRKSIVRVLVLIICKSLEESYWVARGRFWGFGGPS